MNKLQIFFCVFILDIWLRFEVELVLLAEELVVVVERKVVINILVEADASLVGPATRYILDGVSTTTEYEKGEVPALDNFDASSMTSQGSIIGPKLVKGERISPTLENHNLWPKSNSDSFHDIFVYLLKAIVVQTIEKWNVDSVSLAFTFAHILDITGTREEISIPMEAHGHHSIRGIECLLHPVSMVDVDVDVEDTLVVLQ